MLLTKKTNNTYFDILGPYYQQSYKATYESTKDLYFRVLFENNKCAVKTRFIDKNESFFLIGGMLGHDLIKMDYKKSLLPNTTFDKRGSLSGNYYVAPINYIMDIKQFEEYKKQAE